ncbi:hypothetical protein E8P77_22255 [Soehngenia saccharolytica]|nr:hypothetical protein E8P77_22255 [Soehngenia saccharolytica]
MCFFVQTNHTRKELLFLMFKEINLRNHSSLHKLFYGLISSIAINYWSIIFCKTIFTICFPIIIVCNFSSNIVFSCCLDKAYPLNNWC